MDKCVIWCINFCFQKSNEPVLNHNKSRSNVYTSEKWKIYDNSSSNVVNMILKKSVYDSELFTFQKASWQLLLNSKYQNMKPEIKVNLMIENDTKNKNEEGKKAGKGQNFVSFYASVI